MGETGKMENMASVSVGRDMESVLRVGQHSFTGNLIPDAEWIVDVLFAGMGHSLGCEAQDEAQRWGECSLHACKRG